MQKLESKWKKRRKCANLVLLDLGKCCKISIYFQKVMPIQPRTSPLKFGHLAAKSEKDTVPYLSSKPRTSGGLAGPAFPAAAAAGEKATWEKAAMIMVVSIGAGVRRQLAHSH